MLCDTLGIEIALMFGKINNSTRRHNMTLKEIIQTKGISIKNHRRPSTLLDACCHWDSKQGGTIHQYSNRLSWAYGGNKPRQGPTWYLMLDDFIIGWFGGPKKHLPEISPSMNTGHLDYLPIDYDIIS